MSVIDLATRREVTVSGSEAAAACGVDPYRSRVMLWAEKTGRVVRDETEAMRWGKLLEPVVYAELERQGWALLPAPSEGWVSASVPWFTGHPDGFVDIDGERGVLEVKTGGQWTLHDWLTDARAPIAYTAQMLHYMILTGCSVGLFACLIGGQRLELRVIEADAITESLLIALEDEFRGFVQRDEPPPPDGSTSTKEAIAELYPEATMRTVRLLGDEWEALKELRARREQLATVKTQEAELVQRLQLYMGDATVAISPFDERVIEWGNVTSRRFDSAAFRSDHPDEYERYRLPTTTRRFTLK